MEVQLLPRFGIYKMSWDIRTNVKCKKCGCVNRIPAYINVGRYTKWVWFCVNCFEDNTFDNFFGCENMEEALMVDFKIGRR